MVKAKNINQIGKLLILYVICYFQRYDLCFRIPKTGFCFLVQFVDKCYFSFQ